MTKKFATVASHSYANPSLPVMMLLSTTVEGLFI